LHLHQPILIACQRFQLGDLRAVGLQAAQLLQIKAAHLGQQMGIDAIGRGLRRLCATDWPLSD
jgi:hypothetical protein